MSGDVPINIGDVRLALRSMLWKRFGVCRSQISRADPMVGASSDRCPPRGTVGPADQQAKALRSTVPKWNRWT